MKAGVVRQGLRAKTLTVLLACAVAAGCTTTDPNTGEKKASNTTKGAGIGAAAGAVLGALTSSSKDRGKGALIGAAAGGLIGGGVGQYQDRQEKQMRDRLANSGVEVKREGDTLKLLIPGNVSFPTGSSTLSPQFNTVLDQVATTLAEYPATQVQIVGHTDSVGSSSSNEQLSRTRASAVAIYLGAKGIPSSRMQVEGMGSSMPIASNASAEGRAQNRRVEMKIVPVQGEFLHPIDELRRNIMSNAETKYSSNRAITNMFVGRVADTPELKRHGETQVAKFVLIDNIYAGTDDEEETQTRELRLRFTAFGSKAETISKHVAKGDQLILTYTIRNNDRPDPKDEGKTIYGYEFVVESFRFGAPGALTRKALAQAASH